VAKQVELPPAKPAEPWEITIGGPGWLAGVNANLGTHGFTTHVEVGPGKIIINSNVLNALAAEVHKGRFGLLGGYLYINAQDSAPGTGLVSKTDLSLQEYISQLAASWRLIEGPHGWLDALGGFRFFYIGDQTSLQANQDAINEASTLLVDRVAQQLATSQPDLRGLIRETLNLKSLGGLHPPLPVPPLAADKVETIRNAVQDLIQSEESELAAAIRTNAQARVNELKGEIATRVANRLIHALDGSFSLYQTRNRTNRYPFVRRRVCLASAPAPCKPGCPSRCCWP
jgi:hypothetical protein